MYVRHNPDVITSMSKLPIESPNDVRIRRIKPVEENSSDFLVQWEWDYSEGPHDDEGDIVDEFIYFLIEFRRKGSSDSWARQTSPINELRQSVLHFDHSSAMEIRVALETCIGRSDFSQVVFTDSADSSLMDNIEIEKSEPFIR